MASLQVLLTEMAGAVAASPTTEPLDAYFVVNGDSRPVASSPWLRFSEL